MAKTAKACERCGATMMLYPSQMARRFCSATCAGQAVAARTLPPRKPRRGGTAPCEHCGTPVYATARAREAGQGRYCSRACQTAAQTKVPVVKHCVVCGKEMRLKPSQAAREHCSRACQAAGRVKRPLDRQHNGRPAKQDKYGYVMVWEPTHPNTTMKGWQYEHRLVAEKVLGRLLASDEQVHHLNGVKHDNRPENLEVMHQGDHAALTAIAYADRVRRELAELAEYRRRYGPLEQE